MGVMGQGGVAYRSRKSYVVKAMQELRDEADRVGSLQLTKAPPDHPDDAKLRSGLAPSPPEQLRASAIAPRDGFAAGGNGGPAPASRDRVKRGGPVTPQDSLDGDGGAAKLEDINKMLLASDAAEVAAGGNKRGTGKAADEGLEALLAGIAGMELEDDDGEEQLGPYTILPLPILYGVCNTKGGSGRDRLLRNSRAIVLQ